MKTIRGRIFTSNNTFEYGEVIVDGDIITEVNLFLDKCDSLSDEEKATYIIPGLVDIHMHGAVGVDVCRKHSRDELLKVAEYEKSIGITSFCPATMTLGKENLKEICEAIGACCSEVNYGAIPEIKGIYLEGPFISELKVGAQNPEHIMPPDFSFFEELQEAADGAIKVATVAPEKRGAIEFISKVAGKGTRVSLAHTSATDAETKKAFDAGAKQVTHLYNAMPTMSHREPGVVGAAADHDEVMVELICDGIHVDPVMVRNTFRLFGEDRIILISDSMEATGMPDGEYMLGDQTVIKNGSKATLKDGTIAGSVTNLYQCMLNAIAFGIKPEIAIEAATKNPAKAIGVYDQIGSIEAGKEAHLLLTDSEFNLIDVIMNERDIFL